MVPANSIFQSNSTPPVGFIPFPGYSGFVFLASQGGSINALAGGVTLTSAPDVSNAYGAWSDGVFPQEPFTASLIAFGPGTTVTTTTDGAIGLHATAGGVITAAGQMTISTGSVNQYPDSEVFGKVTGLNAFGAKADGVGSRIDLAATTISTIGDGAIGLCATAGGVITASGQTTISTGDPNYGTGLGAFGAEADGAGSRVDLAATTVRTAGVSAYGLYASRGEKSP